MRKKLICTIILAVSLSVTISPKVFAATKLETQDNINKEETTVLENIIKEKAKALCERHGATSVQYAISKGDNIVVSDQAGKYNKNEDKVLTKDNMYGIASISKMYVTTAVMQLVDEGKIDLDIPLTTYIKDFCMADERYKKITPRMLLNHSSGLMGNTDRGSFLFNDNDTLFHDNLLKELKYQKLKAEPGEFSVYCNDGFSLAEILVERVSGLRFTDYLKTHFSDVLGLEHTKTPVDEFDRSLLAKSYNVSKDIEDPCENVNSIGAGGIYSTAEDMCKFVNAITRKDGKGLLSEKSINAMKEKEYLKGVWITDQEDNLMSYGLGWDSVNLFPFNRYGIKALCKGGDSLSYHSTVISLPDFNISMAVVSAGSTSIDNMLFASYALLEYLKDNNIIDDIKEDVNWQEERSTNMPSNLKEFEGLYNTKESILEVSISDDGVLEIKDPSKDETNVYYYTYSGYFQKEGGNEGIRFKKEKNDVTYIEERKYENIPDLGQGAIDFYIAQKVEENKVTDEVRDIWLKRINKPFLVLNEKYSSLVYTFGKLINNYMLGHEYKGYISGNRIKDANTTEPCVKIPMNSGRDLNEVNFYSEDGKNYVKIGSLIGICNDSIPELNSDIKEIKIDNDGYTKYFKVPDNLSGHNITVKSSNKTAFCVYDKEGQCLNNSYINKNKTVKLASGNYIAFAGDVGEKFVISIS